MSESVAVPSPGPPRPTAPRRLVLIGAIVAVVFVLDQVTKLIAVAHLEAQPPVRILGGVVYLSFTRNPGAAFGLGSEFTIIFPFVYLVVIGVIAYFAPKIRSVGWAIALALVMAGALGNLMDRIFRSPAPLRGAVVDFISVFAPYGEKFAIFNVADSAISVGGVLALLLALLGHEMDGTRHRAKATASGPEA